MRARFLIGPAGSGKTFRCLAEIRAQLLAQPEGPPLILLAPKQATFQLERQLLCEGHELAGYTRLQILSFERLAFWLLRQCAAPAPRLLSEQGRVMVLRAVLKENKSRLRLFRAEAALTAFARQLSLDLRELQRCQLSAAALSKLSLRADLPASLRNKLHDLGLLLDAYLAWIKNHGLEDADCLLDIAVHCLKTRRNPVDEFSGSDGQAQGLFLFTAPPAQLALPRIAGIWLDGFAEMTPQELSLLAAIAPLSEAMTLAFCADAFAQPAGSWLSIWSGVNRTISQCRARLESLPDVQIDVVSLPQNHSTRFTENPVLAHLQEQWSRPVPYTTAPGESIRLALCSDPLAEATLAAREILRFVRTGGRFRETAILLRTLNGYHDDLRRTLARYEIPFFLDRRQSITRHPLAELTRCALSVIAFSWLHHDWFGALKTGLVTSDERAVDQMENASLARGWKGAAWLTPFAGDEFAAFNRWRESWTAPFIELKNELSCEGKIEPDGQRLADALRAFWRRLKVERTLDQWTREQESLSGGGAAPHATVLEQINAWLDDVALAFANEPMSLTEWLPILEAGLAGLTVGQIPPALDQVLVGAVDRSRNPDLKLVIVLGVNETVFPALQPSGALLVDSDRQALESCGVVLESDTRSWLGRERFLGYIACTRARSRLVVSAAMRDSTGGTLNLSPFFSHLRTLFPALALETVTENGFSDAQHAADLAAPFFSASNADSPLPDWALWPVFDPLRASLETLRPSSASLPPEMARELYGSELTTSVSRLERFAACPFRFFIDSGMGAQERRLYELDDREIGSFQHAVLAEFHEQLRAENRRWHELTPSEARIRAASAAAKIAAAYHDGLLHADAQTRFALRSITLSLQDFAAALAGWMPQYNFEPERVEASFGREETGLPAWRLDLGESRWLVFRGVIDRIDLCPQGDGSAEAVVIDYKSSDKSLDRVHLDNGLQLQLPAYLSLLRGLNEPAKFLPCERLVPVGVFYVNLNGKFEPGKTRSDVLDSLDDTSAYRHTGRFDLAALPRLDNRGEKTGTQFKYRLANSGQPYKNSTDVMTSEAFGQMLDQVESHLERMGRAIFDGCSAPDPFQIGSERACDRCDFAPICRIDPWTHKFRVLTLTAEMPNESI